MGGSGERTADAYNGSAANAPKLYITYEVTPNNRNGLDKQGEAMQSTVSSWKVAAFPNPFTEKIRLSIEGAKEEWQELQVLNMVGQTVHYLRIPPGEQMKQIRILKHK